MAIAGLEIVALMGFFYGGRLTGNNPTVALVGAIAGGLLGGLVTLLVRTLLVAAIVGLLGAIAAYDLAFLLWVSGSNLLPLVPGLGGSPSRRWPWCWSGSSLAIYLMDCDR
ncbi:MAG: hypothetical protein AAF773_06030 [Cyanobacteria bacterium P01_D01_bin.115]